jgi:3'(2'), 5'-bisphosphate nucleotidase
MLDRDFAEPKLAEELTGLISEAAGAVMRIRGTALAAREKADASPVTAADEAAEDILLDGLAKLLPGIPAISEEAASRSAPQSLAATFALVDPLDGTREILAGRDEFTINVAIIVAGRPVFGLVSAPALHRIWRGAMPDRAERLHLAPGAAPREAQEIVNIRTTKSRHGPSRAMVSRSHADPTTEAWLAQWPEIQRVPCGSALKFCRVAEGAADVYPRFGTTMEWDVAAGDAVVTAAGGAVLTTDGSTIIYGQLDGGLRIPGFIAWADVAAVNR